MTDKVGKTPRLSNREWLQEKLPSHLKDHHAAAQDPSSLLLDDSWALTDCKLREAKPKLRLRALSWPCALAWICAREEKFVEELDQVCRQQASDMDAALENLTEKLSRRFRRPRSAAKKAIELAGKQLSNVLSSGTIEAEGRRAEGAPHTKINPTAWLCFECIGKTAHDAFFNWDQEAVIFTYVQIDSTALLRRWEERPAARLIAISRATWDLPETLYWYARYTHIGYERKVALTREEAADARDRLGQDLRTDVLRARASLRANVPGATESHLGIANRNTSFWQTFSLGEVAIAEFDAIDVQTRVASGIRLTDFTSQRAAVKYLMEERGMFQRPARILARARVARGKPGPKPRSR